MIEIEAAAGDGERERALNFLASPHAARADDAFGRIEAEIRIRIVNAGIAVALAVKTVAHLRETHVLGGVEEIDVGVFAAVERIDGVIGDVKLHHAFAQPIEAFALRMHHNSFGDRRRARGRRSGAAIDLDQADAAGPESIEHVGGAEFGNFYSHLHRRPHDRRTLGHGHGLAVDGQRDGFFRARERRSVVDLFDQRLRGVFLLDERHGASPIQQLAGAAAWRRNLQGNG